MNIVVEFIANLGLDVVKDKITDSVVACQGKKRIEDFLSRQNELNFFVSLDEEIDFGRLADYIQTNLVDEVKERCFGNKRQRGAARQRIMSKAVSYASAHTKFSADRTMKIVGQAVDLLSNFFRRKVNRDLLFIAGEIEDIILDENAQTQALVAKGHEHLENVIRDTTALSVDNSLSKIDDGQLTSVQDKLSEFMNAISAKHTLFPYFGYRMTPENKMISFPLIEEAKERYPESYKITASSVRLGEQPINEIGTALFDKSYRHQLPIHIDVTNAKKYLGDILDPIQTEAEKMIGAHAIMTPPAFPPAFPCYVKIGSETVIPYLLLRTKEILDDGTIIITNDEQENFNFLISIRMVPSTQNLTFTVQPSNTTNKEYLNYRRFLQKALSGIEVTVVATNLNEPIIRGNIDLPDIEHLDEEIDFLEKIVSIENRFGISICIPKAIQPADYFTINRLYDLIQGGYKGEADRFDFSFELTEEVKKLILELTDNSYGIACSAEGVFTIFDQDISVSIFREIESVVIDNLPRLKEKINILDIGDQVKIGYIPSEGRKKCQYMDRIKTENVEDGLLFSKET